MYSNPMSEPIQGGREQHEGEESGGEFIVAGGNALESLNAPKEIFDVVAMPVITAMEAGGLPPAFLGGIQHGECCAQLGAESIGVEALVGHDAVMAQTPPQWSHGEQVVLRAGGQGDRNRPTRLIRDGGELGIQAAFGPPDRLRQLAARRIGSVLMQLDVRAIQVPQPAFGAPSQSGQQTVPQATRRPASPARVDRTPRAVLTGTSRHGQPVRSTYPIAVTMTRSSGEGRPPTMPLCPRRILRRLRLIFLAASAAAAPTPIDSDTS